MADEISDDETRQENAESIAKYLDGDPDGHTVEDIAQKIGLGEAEVRIILDEWRPSPNGTVEYLGQGRGGPWIQ